MLSRARSARLYRRRQRRDAAPQSPPQQDDENLQHDHEPEVSQLPNSRHVAPQYDTGTQAPRATGSLSFHGSRRGQRQQPQVEHQQQGEADVSRYEQIQANQKPGDDKTYPHRDVAADVDHPAKNYDIQSSPPLHAAAHSVSPHQRPSPLSFARGHRAVHVDAADASPYRANRVRGASQTSHYHSPTQRYQDPAGVVVVDDELLLGGVTPVRETFVSPEPVHQHARNPGQAFQQQSDTHAYTSLRAQQDSPDPRAVKRGLLVREEENEEAPDGESSRERQQEGRKQVELEHGEDEEEQLQPQRRHRPVLRANSPNLLATSPRSHVVSSIPQAIDSSRDHRHDEQERPMQLQHHEQQGQFTNNRKIDEAHGEEPFLSAASSRHNSPKHAQDDPEHIQVTRVEPVVIETPPDNAQDSYHGSTQRGHYEVLDIPLAQVSGAPNRDHHVLKRLDTPGDANLNMDEPQEPILGTFATLEPATAVAPRLQTRPAPDAQRPIPIRPSTAGLFASSTSQHHEHQHQFVPMSFPADSAVVVGADNFRHSDVEDFESPVGHDVEQATGQATPIYNQQIRTYQQGSTTDRYGDIPRRDDNLRQSASLHSHVRASRDSALSRVCKVPDPTALSGKRASMPTIMRKIGFLKKVAVEALPSSMAASVLWTSDTLPDEGDHYYPYAPTKLVAIDPSKMLSRETEESLVTQGTPFEIRVCGMSVTRFDFPLGLIPNENELLLYSIESEELGDGTGVTESVPNIHFDFKKDNTVQPDMYQAVPDSRSLVLRSGTAKRQHVNVRFNILEVDEVNNNVKKAISDIGSLSSQLSDIAVINPYMSIITPALQLAGKVGSAALESYARPDSVISIDMNFQLIDPDSMRVSRSGAYLQYGYYFFLSKPCEAKLFASTLTSRNVRLMMRDPVKNEYIPLKHISYVVVRVANAKADQVKNPTILTGNQVRRLRALCEGVFDMDSSTVHDQLKEIMTEIRGPQARRTSLDHVHSSSGANQQSTAEPAIVDNVTLTGDTRADVRGSGTRSTD